MSEKSIVSGCRKINLLAILGGILFLAFYAAHEDLTSEGLRRTQAFLLLGYALYPLFYGACLFLAWKLITMLRHADSFVSIDGSNVLVWTKEIPLREISSVSLQPAFPFVDRLVIRLNDGTETKLNSLALDRPASEVASRIKAAAGLA